MFEPPVAIAILAAIVLRLLRWPAPASSLARFRLGTFAWIGVALFLGYIAAFSVSFGFADAGTPVPCPLAAVVSILGFPPIYLVYSSQC
jgi:hypothetical protein